MRFVVSENVHSSRNCTKIHREGCGYARPPGTKTRYTRWHGPFERHADAREFAEKLGRRYGPDDCKICLL